MTARKELAVDYLRRHPELAAAQLEQWPVEQSAAILGAVPARIAGPVFQFLLPPYASRCIDLLPTTTITAIVHQLPKVRAALLLRGIDEGRREAVLEHLPALAAGAIRLSLNYPQSSVGAWTDSRTLTLRDSFTVAEAKRRVLNWSGFVSDRIFLTDEHNQLAGWVSLTDVLQSPDRSRITEFNHGIAQPIRARAELEDVRDHPDWIDHLDRPVINRRKEIVGSLTSKTFREAMVLSRDSQAGSAASSVTSSEFADLFLAAANATWQVLWQLLLSTRIRIEGGDRK